MRKPDRECVAGDFIPAPIHLPKSVPDALELYMSGRRREAFFCYLERAEAGSAAAQSVVAYMYLLGYVTCDDAVETAVYWATKAADSGDAYGSWVLAWSLLERQDFSEGLSNLLASADQGFSPAFYHLGSFSMNGVILPTNRARAEALLLIACRQGHLAAKDAIKLVYRTGAFGGAKRVRTYVLSPFSQIARRLSLITLNPMHERFLVYYRSVHFENKYRRHVLGKEVGDEIAKRVDEFMSANRCRR